MATDDQQILVTGTAAAPASWVVPGNGQVTPRTVFAHYDGSGAGSAFQPALKVISDGGVTVGVYPCVLSVAAGGSADVSWFPGGELEEEAVGPTAGVIVETLLVDSVSSSPTFSSTVLTSGQQYVITAQGTYTQVNHDLDVGTPNANAMFPGSLVGRISTQVGFDPDTSFAVYSAVSTTLGHIVNFQMTLDGGVTLAHIEPQGGPYTTPQPNYLYRYTVTGQGHTIGFLLKDTVYTDNYGKVQITIQTLGGQSSGGGGGGSLLPPDGSNNSLLRVVSSVPTWAAQPDITESDLSLSDVTTGNVSTSAHGFAPKAPNDATKFLDGTGAYSVPSGAGTISDITSTGSTITVTSPTGPTTNIDLPATGVTAGSYGDGSHVPEITVDAKGRITALTTTGVTGGSGTIGFEIGYTQITAPVNVTSTTEASGTTIISPGALTFDGGPVLVTFFCPFVQTANISPSFILVCLFEGATEITRLIDYANVSGASSQTISGGTGQYRFTPSAASHTYTVTAFVNSTSGTPNVGAGAGGTAHYPPAFVRFTKV